MSGLYDLEGARKAGITDEDSLNHLASVHGYDLAGARAAGIPDSESLSHLAIAKAPAEPVVEKESPEAMGGIGATLGGIGAAGDVIYSKGRPLFRMAEKAMGMDSGAPAVKPRTFLDPSAVAEQAIARRTVAAPDVTGSPEAVKNWGLSQHEGEFLGGSEYKQADQIKKEALAFETANPTQKVLPGSLLAVPEEEAKRLSQQKAALAAEQDKLNQAEVRQVAQTRAERLGERAELKGKANKFGAAKGAGSIAGKVALPIVGGYELGSQGAQAYNRLTRPDLTARDVLAGGANVVGAGAGAVSMVPSKYRIPAAIVSQGAGAVANWLDKRNPRNEEVVEIPQKAKGGLMHLADGGGPKLPGKLGKAVSLAQKAAHEFGHQEPGKMSDWAQQHINKFLVPTQADRMGFVGGPSYSANQLVLPQYKGRAWGSGQKGTATEITNIARDPRFGGAENQIFAPILGGEKMHQSNQIIFDRMVEDFYKHPEKLTPELRTKINEYIQSGGLISGKKSGFEPIPGFDIADRGQVEELGKTFDTRKIIAQHGFGGLGIGSRKSQIIPYEQILKETTDPTVLGAKTYSVGPRAFSLTGEVEQAARPDLNPAYPFQLHGEDLGVTYSPVPSELSLMDFQRQWRKDLGQTTPTKTGKLPEPGYFEYTRGYKPAGSDERIYPRQQITEDWVKELQSSGFADGGLVEHLAKGGKIPEAVVKAYKLFKTKQNAPGELYPLFVNANKSVPIGEWVPAEVGPVAASGKVKSKLGELAYRPGWHAGDLPVATHIGGKSEAGLKAPDFRRPDEVWAEVEMPADVDWQEIANQRARLNKAGNPIPSTAHITDQIPEGGHYRYKTSPNMQGNWLIGGGMKVNKVLTDEEVQAINEAAGVADLPRFTKFDEKAAGGSIEGYQTGGKVGALTALAKKAMPLLERQANKAKFLEGTKVVDHNGNPITMYHHTRDFQGDAFDPSLAQQHDKGYHAQGMYFGSDDYLKRSAYGKNSSGNTSNGFIEGSQVMPVNLSIKNPRYVDVADQSLYGMPSETLKQQGYDGVIVTKDDSFQNVMGRTIPRQKVYNAVAFEPTQVKSAIGNEGTFDPTDPRLHKAEGGSIEGYAPGGKIGALTRLANKAKFLEPSAIKDRLYHGTTQNISAFDPTKKANTVGDFNRGMTFVSPNPKLASYYAGKGEGANVMPVHVQVRNPFDYQNPEHVQSLANKIVESGNYHPSMAAEKAQQYAQDLSSGNWGNLEQANVMRAAQDLGHDAMYMEEHGVKNLGIFDPKRIKSAIGNEGAYDVANPDIAKKQGGLIHLKKKKKK